MREYGSGKPRYIESEMSIPPEWYSEECDCEDCLAPAYPPCPACGSPIDYCQGHGIIGDPHGHAILNDHVNCHHVNCHPFSDCKG